MQYICVFFQTLDFQKYTDVRNVLSRNINSTATTGSKAAPLATPEHIEIGETYAQVKVSLANTS